MKIGVKAEENGRGRTSCQIPLTQEALLLWDLAWGSCSFPSIKGIKRALLFGWLGISKLLPFL